MLSVLVVRSNLLSNIWTVEFGGTYINQNLPLYLRWLMALLETISFVLEIIQKSVLSLSICYQKKKKRQFDPKLFPAFLCIIFCLFFPDFELISNCKMQQLHETWFHIEWFSLQVAELVVCGSWCAFLRALNKYLKVECKSNLGKPSLIA